MKSISIGIILFLSLVFPPLLSAGTFNVSNVTQFQTALNSASANGQDDLIIVSAGFYDLSSVTLTYNPSDNKVLTIVSYGPDRPILYGGNTNQIMNIRTIDLPDDSNAHITINGLAFRNGRELDGSGGGLKIAADYANITLENIEFKGNVCKYTGGGAEVISDYGTVTVSNSTFIDNANVGGGPSYVTYSSGGLYAGSFYGEVNLKNNTFIDNSAVDEGGGAAVMTSSGTANISNNIFRSNFTGSSGGGCHFTTYSGLLNITNNTFIYNSSIRGGGFYIYLYENSATANIYNNIIWGNASVGASDDFYIMDDGEWDYTGSTVYLYANDYKEYEIEEGDNIYQVGNKDVDPCFTLSFHLQAGSPCIDAGTNAAPNLPTLDFEGDPRIIDGNYNGAAYVDIGADENDGSIPVPVFDGADFTGDGHSDLSVWRLSNGRWFIDGIPAVTWGKAGDIPVNGNYDGDVNDMADIAVWRPSNGKWYILGMSAVPWGTNGDIPVPGDYDGDGTTEIAVWRPSDGKWHIQGLSTVAWGTNGDIPVPGDYDGDGTTEAAVWRPSNGKWYILGMSAVPWGTNGDIPVPGDYDGDGTTEAAVWRPTTGKWHISGSGGPVWGKAGDIPVPGDYDGDGTAEAAVWRPSNGRWYIFGIGSYLWGTAGDRPLVR
jgi:hypothetical protein